MGKTKKKKVQDPLETTMSLGDHLEELRSRLILAIIGLVIGTIVCMVFGKWIISVIERPYIQVMGEEARMMSIAPAEGFASYMKITFIAGLIITSPWVFYQLWMFVAAGLYPHERKYVQTTVPFSAALFVAGAMFFLFVVARITIRFLVFFNERILDVDSRFTFPNYISFVTLLMLVFGLAFQTPIAIFILNKTGLVSIQTFTKSRKYVILCVFIVGAVLTPPDPISQITLAVPLYALFELGILLSWISERRRKKAIASED
jgi:sec-independent protein translocase protein TatC